VIQKYTEIYSGKGMWKSALLRVEILWMRFSEGTLRNALFTCFAGFNTVLEYI